MASIVPGYEYDIFISYRQKDNKHDGWVTEFVDNLKGELETTFKEDISVYFDINPHDGLLETHDVDASLKEKLKCLIFIPIISRTYCDPKSFAWEHEFKAFVELASSDQFGLKVKLPDSNIANRVLPVQIHDLNAEDRKLVEGELGGYLRGIEFTYKEPGVNRPLMANEDNPDNNLNKTFYRNQINKVANAINEIIDGLRSPNHTGKGISEKIDKEKLTVPINLKPKIIIAAITVLVLILLGYFFIPKLSNSSVPIEKSIAVLPFTNMTNDPEQEYFSEGIMEEILNHLFKIGGLKIPSSTSSMRFKGSKLSIREIAKELNVSYILEGNVYRSGDNVRIIVRLISGKNERLLWTDNYKEAITATNLLETQSAVAQQVAIKMNVVINPEAKERIEVKPTLNTEAYILFLQAWNQDLPFDTARSKLERAISLDPGYADAYALLAHYWINSGGFGGDKSRDQVLENAEPLLKKALQLDNNSLLAHINRAILSLYYNWDFQSVEKEFQIFNQINMKTQQTIISEVRLVYRTRVKASERLQVKCSKDAFHIFMENWDQDSIEHIEEFKLLLMNRSNSVLGIMPVSKGGLSGTVTDVRLIFQGAIKANASGIIICHNHPSGNLNPSESDIKIRPSFDHFKIGQIKLNIQY